MSGQTGGAGSWEPATEAGLGRAASFPQTRVGGPGVGLLCRSSLFLLEVRPIRRSWWLWAQGPETRRNCGIGPSVPHVPGTDVLTVAWPQGLRRCHHIRILKSDMGHRCQSSGPLPFV